MTDVLNIVFHCFWHWLGSLMLLAVAAAGIGGAVQITRNVTNHVSRHER